MPNSVNSFQIRRAAAAASRGTTWKSFFRSIFSKDAPKSNGFDADLEAGQDLSTSFNRDNENVGAFAGEGTDAQDQLRRRNTGQVEQSERLGSGKSTESENGKEKKRRAFFKDVRPKKPFTVRNQIRRILFGNWINVFLLAAPVGIAINFAKEVPRGAVFAVNFIAIIPLAKMLSDATEEIALRTGETLGGLLNASFGWVPLRYSRKTSNETQ